MSSQILNISKVDFDEHVNNGSGVVLVDIWADWCGPCKQLAPILDEIAEIYTDEVKVFKLNADQNDEIAERYNVRGLPTMLIFVNAEEKDRILGLTSKTRIAQVLDKHLEG